jgi:membrane protease YdiL (CAAX protease family)
MKSTYYRLIELFIIFVLVPISLVIDISIRLQIGMIILGFIYVLIVMVGVEKTRIHINKHIEWRKFWKLTLIKFIVIACVALLYVSILEPENLFKPVKKDYRIWLLFLGIYSFLSVYPQELIYRTFFFQRYQDLFKNEYVFILVNAALFSLAHLFFRNTMVMIIAFIGGLLFAFTFKKTKSTLLVSIEHAIYGCWLFTVGMGEMLGFPS